MSDLVPYHQQWFSAVPRSSRAAAIGGWSVLIFGVLGFTLWGSTAPIEGAVVAPGYFVATSQNKIVQHLEGGIIREILVREGDRVTEGQVLLRLDGTQAGADLARLRLRHATLQAVNARLKAEAAQTGDLAFPPELLDDADVPGFVGVLESQRAIFDTRAKKLASEVAIGEKTIATLEHRIAGDEARLAALREQIRLLEEEIAGKQQLYDQKLVRKPEYLSAKRAQANAYGEVGRIESEIRDGRERILSAMEQITRIKTVAVQAAVEELQSNGSELKDIRERIAAIRAVLSRLDVVAPVAGVVVRRHYHTPGGVIRPGNDIFALLPAGDELVIEANVRPQDIDPVKKGQDALVRLTALNQRTTPMVEGKVIYLSADAVTNDKKPDKDNIYVARVRLDVAQAALIEGFLPTPGMPAEVYIKTGQRTFFEYLAKPILDTMSRAFREH